MARTSTTSWVQYTGSGTGPYPITFDFDDDEDVKVSVEDADGGLDDLTYSSEYSVSGSNVYTTTSYAATYTVTVYREPDRTQEVDFVNFDTADNEVIETALDKLTDLVNILWEKFTRSLRFPINDASSLDFELPAAVNRKGKYLKFDDTTGEPEAATVVAQTITISDFGESLIDDETAEAARTTLGVAYSDIDNRIDRLKGLEMVSLTNHDNGSKPAVAANSWLDVNGEIQHFAVDTDITGSVVTGMNYIKFVDDQPTFASTAPSWDDTKQGWYEGDERFVFTLDYDGSSVYSNKMKLQHEQWPEFLKPNFMARQTKDLELDGTAVTQRVIYCRNLTVSANTTLKARTVWVEGNLTIDAGVTLTIEGLEYNPYTTDLSNDYSMNADKPGGLTGGFRTSGAPGFRGGKASNGSGGGPGGGGFGVGGSESGGTAGGHSNGISIANGGNSANNGGGGGATCAGGGGKGTGAPDPSGDNGKGGEVIFFIVKGNFINNGTITCNGHDGMADGSYGTGGGGAGIVVIFAFGSTYTGGTINCVGGDGGNGPSGDGGGGGGGYIAEIARTASFATKSVVGGTGPGSATDGAAGITETYDISDGSTEFICTDGDADAILPKIMHLIEGGVV